MKPVNGVVTALVTAVEAGKVKLKFPWLHESDGEERESNWARIATAMAGNGRGTFLMPEVGDEALVAFEKGSFEHPYVIGFLWNGKDRTPESDTHTRVIKTTSGHTVTFNDNSAAEEVVIESQGGQKVALKDTPTGSITVETAMGNKIEFSDMGGSIKLTALKDITLEAPLSITLSSASISLNAPTVSMGTMLNVTPATFTIVSPTIQMTGVTTITGTTTIAGPSGFPVIPAGVINVT